MIKKLGVVTVGVAAGLVAIAPFASATESHHGGDHHESGSCNVLGGNATANGGVEGDNLTDALAQAPVGGLNSANIVCNSILNDNLSGNVADVSLGDGLLSGGDLGGGLGDLGGLLGGAPTTEAPVS